MEIDEWMKFILKVQILKVTEDFKLIISVFPLLEMFLVCEYVSFRPPEKLFQYYIHNKLNHLKHMLAMSVSTIMT